EPMYRRGIRKIVEKDKDRQYKDHRIYKKVQGDILNGKTAACGGDGRIISTVNKKKRSNQIHAHGSP
ncbi:21811_t:CDS:1, partial [Gigaspora rosea]